MKKILTVTALVLALGATSVAAKVIGSVNGIPIKEKEANKLLKVLTKGKLKYSQLKPQDKKEIVKRLAVDKLVIKTAYRNLSKKERDFVIANAYMAKKTRGIKVTNSEAKKAYNNLKKSGAKIESYSKVKKVIKMQLRQKKVVDRLMKKAKIVVK